MSVKLLDSYIGTLSGCEFLKESDVKALCRKARDILSLEENVVTVNAPVTICGDIHGQFHDLVELFKIGGECPYSSYVFMGDFVDRGYDSVETFLLLLTLKVRYPDRVTLLRGNHKSRQISQVYGFYDECVRKYGSANVWQYCTEVFDVIALAAVVSSQVFCVHGGLSPSANAVDDILKLNRKQEVPYEGPMCDMLWSDPDDILDWGLGSRGPGFQFGSNVVRQFNEHSIFSLIARAHQLVMEGYRTMFDDSLVTVWSAPNYCYRCGNVAAILELDEYCEATYQTYEAAPQDSLLPKQQSEYFL
jgi:serine/threonine-protein phosphatase 4 catalytic subunit